MSEKKAHLFNGWQCPHCKEETHLAVGVRTRFCNWCDKCVHDRKGRTHYELMKTQERYVRFYKHKKSVVKSIRRWLRI